MGYKTHSKAKKLSGPRTRTRDPKHLVLEPGTIWSQNWDIVLSTVLILRTKNYRGVPPFLLVRRKSILNLVWRQRESMAMLTACRWSQNQDQIRTTQKFRLLTQTCFGIPNMTRVSVGAIAWEQAKLLLKNLQR